MPVKNKRKHGVSASPDAAGFVVDRDLNVLELLGPTAPYVEFSPGAASLQLGKIVHPALRPAVFEMLDQAWDATEPVRREDVRFASERDVRTVAITVRRTVHPKSSASCLEIRFEDQPKAKRRRRPERVQERSLAELERAYAELEASHESLRIALSEREAAEAEAGKQRDFVEKILEAAKALVVVLDRDGRVVRFNQACAEATGWTPGELENGRIWDRLIPADQQEAVREVFKDLISGQFPSRFENDWLRKDGTRVRLSWSNTVLMDSAGSVTYVIGVGIDVTEQRNAEAALRDSDARNRALVEAAPLGIVAIDRSNEIQAANEALVRMFGYERGELLGQALDVLLPERFRGAHRRYQESFFRTPVSRPMGASMALFGLSKDGREFPIEVGLGHFEATDGAYAVAFVTDISEKVRAQKTIEKNRDEIRDLAARLMRAQEDEQSRIARELHDGLVQELVALKLDLSVLARNPAIAQAGLLDEVKRAEGHAQSVAEAARAISHQLHPAALERLGLVPALRANATEVRRATGISVRVEAHDAIPMLPREVALVFYRIAQEAIWNATRHSGSDDVTVAIRTKPGELILEVQDQGKGFDVAGVRDAGSLGLVSMEERARLIGAELEIDSEPGQGTIVRIQLKLEPRT